MRACRDEAEGSVAALPPSPQWVLSRRFSWPSLLAEHERVWLLLEDAARSLSWSLNDRPLGTIKPGCSGEAEITGDLTRRNLLIVNVSGMQADALPWKDIALEVRCEAFLRSVQFEVRVLAQVAWLEASGDVVGSDRPQLELCLLVNNRTIAHQKAHAGPGGVPFHFPRIPLKICSQTLPASEARVELMCGGSVWHVEVQPIDGSFEPQVPPSNA